MKRKWTITEVAYFIVQAYNHPMTGPQAISIIHRLGISQAKFGRLVGLSPTAITKWANGQPPSKPVATLLRLLEARPELVHALEQMRVEKDLADA